MGATMDQMKMIKQLRKTQKELKNEIVEVEAGDGAVVIQITGELKIKKVELDPEKIDSHLWAHLATLACNYAS